MLTVPPSKASGAGSGVAVATEVAKLSTDGRETSPGEDLVQLIAAGRIHLVVNTPRGRRAQIDSRHIRAAARTHHIPYFTTVAAARAAATGLREWLASATSLCDRCRNSTQRTMR